MVKITTSTKFLHVADVHLGKKQYHLNERYNDYFRAFRYILNEGIEKAVDFFLICGDLIDSEQGVTPSMLGDIISSITEFKDKCKATLGREIPILCIEGNHENPFFSDHTWLKLLTDLKLIVLLSGEYNPQTKSLTFGSGGKYTVNNTCVYGVSYYGTSTSDLYPLIRKEIKKFDDQFNILMMHFGITKYDSRKPGEELTQSLIDLHENIDYLALGHFHKQYVLPEGEEDSWILNPGSLENNEITELETDRGAFLIEVFDDATFQFTKITCENGTTQDSFSIPNRKFFAFNETALFDLSETNSFSEAMQFVLDRLKKLGIPPKTSGALDTSNLDVPVVYFTLSGIVPYSRREINISSLREAIMENFDVLGVRILNRVLSSMDEPILMSDDMTFDQMEKEILEGIIDNEEEYKLHKDKIIDLFLKVKKGLKSNPEYDEIKSFVSQWFDTNITMFLDAIKKQEEEPIEEKVKKTPEDKAKKKRVEKEVAEAELDFDVLEEPNERSEEDDSDLIDDRDLEF